MMEKEPKPWERQTRETARAFKAFSEYRDTPALQRSMPRVASELGYEIAQLQRWSQKWGWVERAAQWDDELDRVKREAALEHLVKMAEKHAAIASNQLMILSRPAATLLKRMASADISDFDEMSTSELFDMIVAAGRVLPGLVGVERVSRGAANTETIAIEGPKTPAQPDTSFTDDAKWAEQMAAKLRESGKLK